MMTAAMRPLTRLAAVVLIAVASFACKSNKNSQDRTAAAAASQAAGQIQLVEGGLVMFTDAGSVALGTNWKIPRRFPGDHPHLPRRPREHGFAFDGPRQARLFSVARDGRR